MPAPFYADEIAALEKAAAKGASRVESNGESVTYRSMSDLLSALNYFKSQAAAALSGAGSTTLAAFDRE